VKPSVDERRRSANLHVGSQGGRNDRSDLAPVRRSTACERSGAAKPAGITLNAESSLLAPERSFPKRSTEVPVRSTGRNRPGVLVTLAMGSRRISLAIGSEVSTENTQPFKNPGARPGMVGGAGAFF
jgi:hypothetical protein